MSVKFPAGRYYVGDLCYVISEKDWRELLDQSGFLGLEDESDQWFGKFKGYKIFSGSTAHGDGTFYDNAGREYSVDAGVIGIIDAAWLDGKEEEIEQLGNIIVFENDFEVSMPERGLFDFGGVIINTDFEGDGCDYCGYTFSECDCGEGR